MSDKKKTDEIWDILNKVFWIKEMRVGENEVQRNSLMYLDIEKAMIKYSKIKNSELESEIKEMRVKHQMFIGAVSEKIGFIETALIVNEVTKALKK